MSNGIVEKLGERIKIMAGVFNTNHEIALKGNKAAATRARTTSSELTRLLKEYRAASIAATKE